MEITKKMPLLHYYFLAQGTPTRIASTGSLPLGVGESPLLDLHSPVASPNSFSLATIGVIA